MSDELFPFDMGEMIDRPIDSHVCWDQRRCLLLWGSAHLMLLLLSGLRDYTPMWHDQEYDFLCIVIKIWLTWYEFYPIEMKYISEPSIYCTNKY